MNIIQSYLLPVTFSQWVILTTSLLFVVIAFQLLPFKWRKQIGLVQVTVLLLVSYLGFIGAQYVIENKTYVVQKDNKEKQIVEVAPDVESWVSMRVKVKALHLRSCKMTYCDSLALLPIGTKIMVDLSSNDKNWVVARANGLTGYVSSIYLERDE